MEDKKTIKNKIVGFELKEWSQIKGYDFNNLKSDVRNVTKLEQSILNNGFTSPFIVWSGKDYVIDGTGRWLALQNLEKAGVVIPPLPIILIEAKDVKEAKKLAMSISSQHGLITQDSLSDFLKDDFKLEEIQELSVNEIELPELDFYIQNIEVSDIDDKDEPTYSNPDKLSKAYDSDIMTLQVAYAKDDYDYLIGLVEQYKDKHGFKSNSEVIKDLIIKSV
jgi:hypothetical protein